MNRRLLFPRHVRFAEELAANSRLSSDALIELNQKRRCDLALFAFETIPFYQRKYREAGVEAGDLNNPDAFSKLPVLERQDIIDHSAELHNPAFRVGSLPVVTTGGSTGIPLKTYSDPRVPHSVLSWRMLQWWGTDIGDNSAYLYRSVPEGWRRLLQKVVLLPARREWIFAARMTKDNMESFYRSLVRIRPRYLVGYVGAVDVFARFLEHEGYQLPGLKAIWTTSAPLPEITRSYLERVFGCKAYTQYGSCEFYWIASECAHQCGMHIGNDVRHVEVVDGHDDPVPTGVYGELIVTDLLNRAFPLIRYRLGDRGRLLKDQCKCGLPFPMMDYVKGRTTDLIWTRDGTATPGEYWAQIFDDFTDTIKAFQVRQTQDLKVYVHYEAYAGADAGPVVSAVATQLQQYYGSRLEIEFVESVIELNDNGKSRFVVSEVKR